MFKISDPGDTRAVGVPRGVLSTILAALLLNLGCCIYVPSVLVPVQYLQYHLTLGDEKKETVIAAMNLVGWRAPLSNARRTYAGERNWERNVGSRRPSVK